MKVSVIVPVYNVEQYLKKCLDSLVEQTLDELEALVVDDGSTDASAQIVKEYAEKYPQRIKAFYKENGGQGSARNLALTHAMGEYIGFVDSDDWVDPQMYEIMYRKAVEEALDIVVCDMVEHFPDKVVYHKPTLESDKFHQTPSACNKLFKRTLVGEEKFLTGLWYEDFDFTTKLLFQTDRIGSCQKDFYYCHCRPVSTMRNHNARKNLDMLEILDDLSSFVHKNGLDQTYGDAVEYMVLEHLLITTINRVAQQNHPEKEAVIGKMRSYVLERYPNFRDGNVFRSMPRNRRIIASLNAKGLHGVSRLILSVNGRLK